MEAASYLKNVIHAEEEFRFIPPSPLHPSPFRLKDDFHLT